MSAFFDFARQQTDDNEISVSVVLRCHDNEISVSVVPTTFNGRVGDEVRRQPEEGRRHVARPEKKRGRRIRRSLTKRSVSGTREPEVGWEREKSGIGFGHSAVRGPAVSPACNCIAMKPPSAPARFLLAKSTNYASN